MWPPVALPPVPCPPVPCPPAPPVPVPSEFEPHPIRTPHNNTVFNARRLMSSPLVWPGTHPLRWRNEERDACQMFLHILRQGTPSRVWRLPPAELTGRPRPGEPGHMRDLWVGLHALLLASTLAAACGTNGSTSTGAPGTGGAAGALATGGTATGGLSQTGGTSPTGGSSQTGGSWPTGGAGGRSTGGAAGRAT